MTDIMKTIIEDIEDLRTNRAGEQHGYFTIGGKPTEDDFCIDTIDICKALINYEIDYEFEDEIDMCDKEDVWYQPDFAERYIDYLIELGYIEDWDNAKGNNSYNWSAPVSNSVDYTEFKSLVDDSIYVLFKVHRWGDVRTNYTDNCILKFDNDYEWYEAFDEVNRSEYVEVDGREYYVEINFWRDGFEVYDETWEYIDTVYGYDKEEVVECLKEKLKQIEQK